MFNQQTIIYAEKLLQLMKKDDEATYDPDDRFEQERRISAAQSLHTIASEIYKLSLYAMQITAHISAYNKELPQMQLDWDAAIAIHVYGANEVRFNFLTAQLEKYNNLKSFFIQNGIAVNEEFEERVPCATISINNPISACFNLYQPEKPVIEKIEHQETGELIISQALELHDEKASK